MLYRIEQSDGTVLAIVEADSAQEAERVGGEVSEGSGKVLAKSTTVDDPLIGVVSLVKPFRSTNQLGNQLGESGKQ